MLSGLALRAFLSGLAGKLMRGLSSLSFWQLMFGAALIFGGIQTLRVHAEQRHAGKLSAQVIKLSEQLKSISSARNVQRQVTRDRIKVVNRGLQVAEGKAKVIEQAALPGNCRTPPQILQADL